MRRMRNRILLSGVAALLSAAVIAGPAAASGLSKPDVPSLPCAFTCLPDRDHGKDYGKDKDWDRDRDHGRDRDRGHGHGKDCLNLLGIKICLKLGISS